MTHWDKLNAALAPHGLLLMGAMHQDGHTRALIGADANWWPVFQGSREYQDGHPDPIDRWSKRIIQGLAPSVGATTVFPSDGPPCAPFIAWALETGRFWTSPVGMMVHHTTGMMVSIRGALVWGELIPLPNTPGSSTCTGCAKPCETACPVGALSAETAYNVGACHTYLDSPDGQTCMTHGCAARRACPVSQSFGRPAEQSAFHMKAFHPDAP